MGKWARIEKGMVVETVTSNPAGKYYISLVWISCPLDVFQGYSYNHKDGFVKPQPEKTSTDAQIMLIADQRFKVETGGVMFGEYEILTDRESQQMLDTAIEKIRRGLIASVEWKCGNRKWLTIDEKNMNDIELLVINHVQSAFSWEKDELKKLEG